ncbi:PAS domain-containing protein [Plantactinospora endophytica]|uniref:PAS domain-containing protein n=1 Tax=Plantactinospora endophytica TaxID=673535 RepID=UPI001EF18B87|nr:PAS domain-containing protein [Plantactinospora endophytica]
MEHGSTGFDDVDGRGHLDGLSRWSETVSTAAEPCLLIDRDTTIAAVSTSCCQLLGLGRPFDALGRPLLGSELRLLDFTAARGDLTEQDVDKIPPLLALHSGRLARGLLRVRCPEIEGPDATVDAIATPILTDGQVAGSLTFFSEV